MQALLLPVGPEWYAVDAAWAREVAASPEVVRLPTAPASVVGVFNLRGEIVPLFDVAALLGVGAGTAPDRWPWAVVVDTPLGPAALAITAVPEVAELGPPTGRPDLAGTVSTHAVGDRLAVLLDVEAVLAPARIGGRA